MNRRSNVSRRSFVKRAGAAAFAVPLAAGTSWAGSPNSKLHFALVGAGGRGSYIAMEAMQLGGSLVALCDVDRAQLANARKFLAEKTEGGAAALDRVKAYEDYRELLDKEKSLDAVMIATGSRWHAPISVAFMKAGKHVYCEKPPVRKLAEARELIELVPKCKVATQTGTQGASGKACRRAVEVIHSGILGQIHHAYLWCDGYGPNPPSHSRPAGEDPVPAGLNWDFWLGPSPLRPFKKGIYHPGCLTFQNWIDLCNGMLAGQGAHTFDLPVRALRLDYPVRVEAERPEPLLETFPSKGMFRFEFAARGGLAPVSVWWSDGGRYPPDEVMQGLKVGGRTVPKIGCLFMGEKGEMCAGGWGEGVIMRLAGERNWRGVLDHEAARSVPVTLPRAPGDNHVLEWVQACRGGPATFTGLDIGAHAAEVYLPGILSLRLGRAIEWDGRAMKATNAPEAEPLIQKSYRTKWMI
jgi:hypothetical protein